MARLLIRWCAHGMVQDEELHADYHNRPTESLAGRSVEYLYARFAWDIFPKVIGFLQSTQPRRLAVRRADGEVEVRIFSTQECKDLSSVSTPRATELENHWIVKGWMIQQGSGDVCGCDDGREYSRGRKRFRESEIDRAG